MEKQWYLSRGDKRLGPFSIAKLRQLVAAGKVAKEDRLCEMGTLEWRTAADVEELFPKPKPEPVQVVATVPVETIVRSPSAMQAASAYSDVSSPRLAEYLEWRRVRCIVLLPIAIAAMAIGVYVITKRSDEGLSQLGKFIRMAVPMSHIGLPLGAAVGVLFHRRFRESAFGMLLGWGIAFLVIMSLAFIPLSWLIEPRGLLHRDVEPGVNAAGALVAPIAVMFGFAVLLLGLLFGAARIRSLLPEMDAPAWIMLAAALFLGVYGLGGYMASMQLQQSPWPIIAFALMTASPLALVIDWKTLLRCEPRSESASPTRNLIWFNTLLGGGAFVLIVSFCTAEVDGVKLVTANPTALWYILLNFASSVLATAILCADGVLSLSMAHWRLNRPFHASREAEEADGEFERLSRSM